MVADLFETLVACVLAFFLLSGIMYFITKNRKNEVNLEEVSAAIKEFKSDRNVEEDGIYIYRQNSFYGKAVSYKIKEKTNLIGGIRNKEVLFIPFDQVDGKKLAINKQAKIENAKENDVYAIWLFMTTYKTELKATKVDL